MNINTRIPQNFYNLFNSKYLEFYQLILIALYEESANSYSLLGLTHRECRDIIDEKIAMSKMDWSQEQVEDEGMLLTRTNAASVMLGRLEEWGWLRKDYDEEINEYVVSFPDYSQMYVDVFARLFCEESTKERESMLSLYSHLFTYYSDKEKNNEILKGALQTSKALLQMLVNMQEGMRGYFDELSKKKTFLGVQEVLVNEINNTDSKKYAILTTTDSFYRYKEDVKELIDKILIENEERKQNFIEKKVHLEKDSLVWRRNERIIHACEEAMELLFKLNREFDSIEKRYNKLIDQKRIFAKRAVARIKYILVEGDGSQDTAKVLVKLLNNSKKKDEILEKLSLGFGLTEKAQVIKEKSFARPKDGIQREFVPQKIAKEEEITNTIDDFVVKPLYTHAEIRKFRKLNEVDGIFKVTKDTVHSVSDLEKLLFVWQEATEVSDNDVQIEIGEEIVTADGLKYAAFTIGKE
ncbi:MAG: DUF5716 family protein [Ruminococcus sp.]|nr:DUF5716 family protein [Ruminococcus sp.]